MAENDNKETVTQVNDGIKLIERRGGLKFGTDALLLAAFLPRGGGKAAEFGCGSGGVSLLAAYRGKASHIDAVEINPDEADIASRNVILNGIEDRISVFCSDIREYAAASENRGRLDIVFSNPPYMKPGHGLSSADAGRDDARRENHGGIFEFASAAAAVLRFGGRFCCVWRPDRLADIVSAMRKSALEPKRMTLVSCDSLHRPSLVLIEAKKGASASLDMTPVFFTHNDDGSPSARYTEMLGGGNI